MNSALYFGRVRHRRRSPVANEFSYRMFMVHLDLSEIDHVFKDRWFWSTKNPAPIWYRRRDFYGDPQKPLAECIQDRMESELNRRPRGAVTMLTHLRCFGYAFNPVTFYYAYDEEGQLDAMGAEITNTPWLHRKMYVLDVKKAKKRGPCHEVEFAKDFFVSPFMKMNLDYRWIFGDPGPECFVSMENRDEDACFFDVTMRLERRAMNGRNMARALILHPWMSLKVTLAIYFQALRLKLKGSPSYDYEDRSDLTVARTKS